MKNLFLAVLTCFLVLGFGAFTTAVCDDADEVFGYWYFGEPDTPLQAGGGGVFLCNEDALGNMISISTGTPSYTALWTSISWREHESDPDKIYYCSEYEILTGTDPNYTKDCHLVGQEYKGVELEIENGGFTHPSGTWVNVHFVDGACD